MLLEASPSTQLTSLMALGGGGGKGCLLVSSLSKFLMEKVTYN